MGNFAVLFLVLCLSLVQLICFQANAQTSGFTAVPLSLSNFELQKPYDVPASDRYALVGGVHMFWLWSTDKPHTTTSNTRPRSEIRIRGYDYTSGVWQFEGEAMIPSGTSATSVMQVFGGSSRATTIMLRVYSGSLTVYRSPVIFSNMYDRWFRVNVIHDVAASNVKVFIDGVQRYEGSGAGTTHHYFKFGVYAEDGASSYMQAWWRNIRVLRRN